MLQPVSTVKGCAFSRPRAFPRRRLFSPRPRGPRAPRRPRGRGRTYDLASQGVDRQRLIRRDARRLFLLRPFSAPFCALFPPLPALLPIVYIRSCVALPRSAGTTSPLRRLAGGQRSVVCQRCGPRTGLKRGAWPPALPPLTVITTAAAPAAPASAILAGMAVVAPRSAGLGLVRTAPSTTRFGPGAAARCAGRMV